MEKNMQLNFELLEKRVDDAMYLTKYVAEQKEKDLSGVDYSDITGKIYKFSGKL